MYEVSSFIQIENALVDYLILILVILIRILLIDVININIIFQAKK